MIDSLDWMGEKGFSPFFFPLIIKKRRKAGRKERGERDPRCQARERGEGRDLLARRGLSDGGIVLGGKEEDCGLDWIRWFGRRRERERGGGGGECLPDCPVMLIHHPDINLSIGLLLVLLLSLSATVMVVPLLSLSSYSYLGLLILVRNSSIPRSSFRSLVPQSACST